MTDYSNEQIRVVAQALLDGLKRQGENFDGPALYEIGFGGDELNSIGVDGRVNLWLLAQDAIEAWESTPHEPK